MDAIRLMLTGDLEMQAFIDLMRTNPDVQNAIRSLIPSDAINDRMHDFWRHIPYDSLERCGFDFVKFLYWIARFDGSIGDSLSIFDSIRRVYLFQSPDLEYSPKYQKAFDLYLDVIGERFDGPEVQHLVNAVIEKNLVHKTKKQRISASKSEIRELFHVVDQNWPRWIQSPEWPMGKHSPMRFISRKRRGECVDYLFEDVDTEEKKVIKQFY